MDESPYVVLLISSFTLSSPHPEAWFRAEQTGITKHRFDKIRDRTLAVETRKDFMG